MRPVSLCVSVCKCVSLWPLVVPEGPVITQERLHMPSLQTENCKGDSTNQLKTKVEAF